MYPFDSDQYKEELVFPKKIPTRSNYYQEEEMDVMPIDCEIPKREKNNKKFRPIIKTNSQNYIQREKVIINNNNNYNSYIIPINKGRNNNIKNINIHNNNYSNTQNKLIPQGKKYYYNNRVIVH